MPLIDLTNPRVICFYLENYEKESLLRMKWVDLHEEQIRKAATFTGKVKNYTPDDVSKALMVAGMATITRDHLEAARHRMTAPVKDLMHAKVGVAKQEVPLMVPIKREEIELLREGRKEYLKCRNKKGPEDKYNFVELNSWKCGWKLGVSELKMRGPAHGRVCHLMHISQSRVGPQPDPDYYASPDVTSTYCKS